MVIYMFQFSLSLSHPLLLPTTHTPVHKDLVIKVLGTAEGTAMKLRDWQEYAHHWFVWGSPEEEVMVPEPRNWTWQELEFVGTGATEESHPKGVIAKEKLGSHCWDWRERIRKVPWPLFLSPFNVPSILSNIESRWQPANREFPGACPLHGRGELECGLENVRTQEFKQLMP